jgi:trk system potassium uptake protein TrkH
VSAAWALTSYRVFTMGLPWGQAFRECAFAAASILTTTGFVTEDFTLWGSFPVMLMLMLMMVGGCTGSTSGGIKVFRFEILFTSARAHILKMRHPNRVVIPLYNDKPISDDLVFSVFTFFALYTFSLAIVVLALAFFQLDFVSALSAATTCLNNVGPGLSPQIGPHGSFDILPDEAKWVLSFAMILGRLEYLTILVLLSGNFWRD